MIMGVAMILPSNLATASPEGGGSEDGGSENQDDGSSDEGTTEDDGWTEDDYEGSPEEQEEQAQQDWEDAGRPGEDFADGGSGVVPEGGEVVPLPGLVGPPGTEVPPPPSTEVPPGVEMTPKDDIIIDCDIYDCGDPDNNNGKSSSSSSSTTTIIDPTASVNEVSNCRVDGSANGIQQKFDTAKYQTCGLYPNGQLAYSNGFMGGCTKAGNTQQLCQAFVDMNTKPTQTAATQLPPQTQPNTPSAIQPT